MQAIVIALCLVFAQQNFPPEPDAKTKRLIFEIQQELIKLPYYGVFDNLAFIVEKGGTVRLVGQVIKTTLRSDAEAKVKRIPGVDTVINEIEILPASRTDDVIRQYAAQVIYSTSSLQLYATQPNPPIHIIVKGGHITLEGAVDNEGDKTVAGLKAREVPGVFDVKNNLQVQR